MSVLNVTKENFAELKSSNKLALIDFYADWCGPCRAVSPIVDELAEEKKEFLIGKINVDDEPELAKEFNVVSIPTLIIMKNGNIVNKHIGACTKAQLVKILEDAAQK